MLELHSYSCPAPDAATATARMRAELATLWPETVHARVLDRVERRGTGAPAFPPGTAGDRPGVVVGAPGLRLAGDYVESAHPTGLMERAAMTGVLAANDVLAHMGARAEPLSGVPARGLLAGLRPPPSSAPWKPDSEPVR